MAAKNMATFPTTVIMNADGEHIEMSMEYHDNGKPEHSFFMASVMDRKRGSLYTAGCDTQGQAVSAGFALVQRILEGQTE